MINDIYEQNGKAYRIIQEDPLMGVSYGYDGTVFVSGSGPVAIDRGSRIPLSIVKIRHRASLSESEAMTKADIIKQLDSKGVVYNARASKADLQKLLEG